VDKIHKESTTRCNADRVDYLSVMRENPESGRIWKNLLTTSQSYFDKILPEQYNCIIEQLLNCQSVSLDITLIIGDIKSVSN
jgi:hypothetical protein